MKGSFAEASDEEIILILLNVIPGILNLNLEEFEIITAFNYIGILSDVLNVMGDESEIDQNGNLIGEAGRTADWIDEILLAITNKDHDKILEMIKIELLAEKRYNVIEVLTDVDIL